MVWEIREYGAVDDGRTVNTAVIREYNRQMPSGRRRYRTDRRRSVSVRNDFSA
ncbi:MAG: hypothetical protein ACLR6I_04490 [Waltera sp.]